MNFYTVHEPPDAPVDRVDKAQSLSFVGDRFSFAAAVLGPIWLAANQVWYGLAIYFAAIAVVAGIAIGAGLSPAWLALMACTMNLIIGFEAPSLKRWALELRGWRPLGTVSGRSLDECERRFLETWLPGQRMSRQEEFIATVDALRATNSETAMPGLGDEADAPEAGRRRGWLRWLRRR